MSHYKQAQLAAFNDAAPVNSNHQDFGSQGQTGPEAMPRLRCDGWTLVKQRRFCELLAECGEVETVSRAVGMTRQTAYRLRCRTAGQAFALAWDAAMLIASRVMIDDDVLMTFHGSVEKSVRVGNTITKHRRTPAMLFATAERLRSPRILGSPAVIAASEDWERCLDLLEQGQVYAPEDDAAPNAVPNPPPHLQAPPLSPHTGDRLAGIAAPPPAPVALPLSRAQRRVLLKRALRAKGMAAKGPASAATAAVRG
jgi:hypothetical protein